MFLLLVMTEAWTLLYFVAFGSKKFQQCSKLLPQTKMLMSQLTEQGPLVICMFCSLHSSFFLILLYAPWLSIYRVLQLKKFMQIHLLRQLMHVSTELPLLTLGYLHATISVTMVKLNEVLLFVIILLQISFLCFPTVIWLFVLQSLDAGSQLFGFKCAPSLLLSIYIKSSSTFAHFIAWLCHHTWLW